MDKVKTLDIVKNWNGFVLTQIKREGNIAIFKKTYKNTVDVVSYEVIKVKLNKVSKNSTYHQKFKDYDYYESYPGSEQFGTYGWDFGGTDAFERANEKFNKLIREEQIKNSKN